MDYFQDPQDPLEEVHLVLLVVQVLEALEEARLGLQILGSICPGYIVILGWDSHCR